jgi:predicted enzyme related to lactoylglutathione lyase
MPPAVHPKSLLDVGTGIRRVVFEARDVKSLYGFYRGVFELDAIATNTADRPGRSALTDGRTDLWFEPLSADGPAHIEGRMVRFTIAVDDAREALRRAANAGAKAVSPPQPGADHEAGAYVVDPVGVRVDIAERPRAAGVTSTTG